MKKDILIIAVILIFITAITSLGILYFSFDTFFMVVKPTMMILLLAITFLFFRKCFKWYASYMMTDKSTFQAKVDRPRIFIFSIFLPALLIVFYSIDSLKSNEAQTEGSANSIYAIFLCVVLISLFAIIFLLLIKTLSKSFERLYLTKVQKIVKNSIRDFKTNISVDDATTIFNKLVQNGYLVYEDFDNQKEQSEAFVNIFVAGILPSEPKYSLQMKNSQINVLFDCFQNITKELDWHNFKRIFTRKDEEINLDSLYSAVSRDKAKALKSKEKYYATDQNIIEFIFSNVQYFS
ncbi:membrane hypothetical protein [Sphingobacterium sp. PM2-P1-29]|nr:membrane hypothetical protein [Sphingobacterium sp. PM2-P1-29]